VVVTAVVLRSTIDPTTNLGSECAFMTFASLWELETKAGDTKLTQTWARVNLIIYVVTKSEHSSLGLGR
jgi:hypothetical protein